MVSFCKTLKLDLSIAMESKFTLGWTNPIVSTTRTGTVHRIMIQIEWSNEALLFAYLLVYRIQIQNGSIVFCCEAFVIKHGVFIVDLQALHKASLDKKCVNASIALRWHALFFVITLHYIHDDVIFALCHETFVHYDSSQIRYEHRRFIWICPRPIKYTIPLQWGRPQKTKPAPPPWLCGYAGMTVIVIVIGTVVANFISITISIICNTVFNDISSSFTEFIICQHVVSAAWAFVMRFF